MMLSCSSLNIKEAKARKKDDVIPLDNLGLSGRTRNVLFHLGIRTLDDLRAVSIDRNGQQRNIGLFAISEIKRALSENESDLAADADEPSKKEN